MNSPEGPVRIARYDATMRGAWDAFVRSSKNGTFLHERAYCEYHADRVVDASLLAFDDRNRIVGLLPASVQGDVVTTHGGLTYGGLLTDVSMTLPLALTVFDALLTALKDVGVRRLVYRAIPQPYHRFPCGEDLVAMFLLDAGLTKRSALAVVDQLARIPLQSRRRRGAMRAAAAGISIAASNDLPAYWELLTQVLRETYDSQPVHSLSEIINLKHHFPQNITLQCAWLGGKMVAGVLVYETAQVARAQYIAAGPDGKEHHALDLLFQTLLDHTYVTKRYFDFGTSERAGARVLNRGLVEQKEGFGARLVPQDQYEVDIAAYVPAGLLNTFGSEGAAP